jgi:16S rRNA (cytosine967-C5)-methyltransferase
VLDACAAPGGKAAALAERVGEGGEVVATDRHARRLELASRQARRLGLENLRCVVRDASLPLASLAAERGFDRALVDAPCSGLGALRRNPDARWRVVPGELSRLGDTQLAILRQAAATLVPGGVLVYSTCTLLPEENEAIVQAFLDEAPEFRLARAEDAPAEARPLVGSDGFLRTLPHRHDADGFFAARLERCS